MKHRVLPMIMHVIENTGGAMRLTSGTVGTRPRSLFDLFSGVSSARLFRG